MSDVLPRWAEAKGDLPSSNEQTLQTLLDCLEWREAGTSAHVQVIAGHGIRFWQTLDDLKRRGVHETRPCTCHPADHPPIPCPRKYAISECRRAAGETPDDLKAALVWLLNWQNAQTVLQECRWAGRGHAPQGVADTVDALCRERWPAVKTSTGACVCPNRPADAIHPLCPVHGSVDTRSGNP